jgi:hypothetical protein
MHTRSRLGRNLSACEAVEALVGKRSRDLEVSFEPPSSGWLTIRLSTPQATLVQSFSHIYPTLEQLCAALCEVGTGVPARSVALLLEPAELEIRIEPTSTGESMLAIRLFEGRGRHAVVDSVFTYIGLTRDLVTRFWRALRRLQASLTAEEFAAAWHAPFPEREMAGLTKLVESWKSSRGAGGDAG